MGKKGGEEKTIKTVSRNMRTRNDDACYKHVAVLHQSPCHCCCENNVNGKILKENSSLKTNNKLLQLRT